MFHAWQEMSVIKVRGNGLTAFTAEIVIVGIHSVLDIFALMMQDHVFIVRAVREYALLYRSFLSQTHCHLTCIADTKNLRGKRPLRITCTRLFVGSGFA
jgi:hypothetical protein